MDKKLTSVRMWVPSVRIHLRQEQHMSLQSSTPTVDVGGDRESLDA